MKFKTLGCELRRRLREQEQKNENICKSCKLDQFCLSVSRSSNANRQIQSHLRFLHQIRLKSMLSTVSTEQRSFEQQPSAMIKPIFATMQRDNTAEHEGSSEINPNKV